MSKKNSQIHVKIETELKETFENKCNTVGISPSEVLRKMINEFSKKDIKFKLLEEV